MQPTLSEFLKELQRWCVKYRLGKPDKPSDIEKFLFTISIELFGGDWKARKHFNQILAENEYLRAMLILYAANKDSDIRDMIEERACIQWAEGLPYDLLSAVKCHMRRCCSEGKG